MDSVARGSEDLKSKVIRAEENLRYLRGGNTFIDERKILGMLESYRDASPQRVRDIIARSLEIKTLKPEETAALLNVKDSVLWEEIFDAAARIKRKVYDNRVVTFAPLYCSSLCVNNCAYCGFRGDNSVIERRQLSITEVRKETEMLAGKLGHKRLVWWFSGSILLPGRIISVG
jgi:2-iminoacetate synthase